MKYKIEEILPHQHPAILIDGVEHWDDISITTMVHIGPECPFFEEGHGVPVHVGIEYMAQSCGAYAGIKSLEQKTLVQIGFLLGTREYKCTQPWFLPNTMLKIVAHEVFRDERMGSFSCRILCDNVELASAQLSVFQPENPSEFLSAENVT